MSNYSCCVLPVLMIDFHWSCHLLLLAAEWKWETLDWLSDRMERMDVNASDKSRQAKYRRELCRTLWYVMQVGTLALWSYVHGLQEALWNRAASLGREVPKQSRSHLAAGIKIQETRSTVLVLVHCRCKGSNTIFRSITGDFMQLNFIILKRISWKS